jgi:hypothetical protein
MKILFLQDDFPPQSFGGAGLVVFDLAKALQKKGHQVFIITVVQKKSQAGEVNYSGLKIFQIYAHYHERWRAYLSLCNPQIIKQVEEIIQEIKPDIVHAHNIHFYLSYHCLKIARKYSRAVFLTVHDVLPFHYGKLILTSKRLNYKVGILEQIRLAKKRYNPFRNIIIRHYLKNLDKIFAVSYALKKALNDNGIRNIEVIYNGIDVDQWKIDEKEVKKFKEKYQLQNKKVIFFGGRLSPAKGGEIILRAMNLVAKEFKEATLLVVGEKTNYAKTMFNMAQKMGLSDKVVFTGWLTGEKLKAAYQLSYVCVFPSLCFETFGLSHLTAMAAQKPVISSYFGGPSEVVLNEQTGYLVNPCHSKTLAKKIIDLLKDSEKAKNFGEAGYKRVKEKFSLEKQVKETLKWYHQYV